MFARYGCYCSPHEAQMADGSWVGKGDPVDQIDEACRHLLFAYKCLTNDYGNKCDSSKPYDWQIQDNGGVYCGSYF